MFYYKALYSKENDDEMSINNFEDTEKKYVKGLKGTKKKDYNDIIDKIIKDLTSQKDTKYKQKVEYDKKLIELKAELSRTQNITRETSIKTIKENRLKELISDIDRQISKPLLSNNTVKITKIKDTFLQEYTYLENISKEMLDSINSSKYKGTDNKIMTIFDSDSNLRNILNSILKNKSVQTGGAKHGISGIAASAASIGSAVSLRAPPVPPIPPAPPRHIPQKVNMLSPSSAILASIASNGLMIRSNAVGKGSAVTATGAAIGTIEEEKEKAKAAAKEKVEKAETTEEEKEKAKAAAKEKVEKVEKAETIVNYFKNMPKNKTFFKLLKAKVDSFKLEKDKDIETFFDQLIIYETDTIAIINNKLKNKTLNISSDTDSELYNKINTLKDKINKYSEKSSDKQLTYTEVIPYTDTIHLYFLLLFYIIKII